MKQRFQPFAKLLRRQKKTILLILTFALATILLSTAISIWLYKPITENFYHFFNQQIPSVVTVETIGVKAYWDQNLKNETTAITWPEMYPSDSNNVTIYIQSVSNINTTLQLQTTNWTFLDSDGNIVSGPVNSTNYMNLAWDYNNATVNPKQIVRITLTLSLDESENLIWFLINNRITEYSFDIIISANEIS